MDIAVAEDSYGWTSSANMVSGAACLAVICRGLMKLRLSAGSFAKHVLLLMVLAVFGIQTASAEASDFKYEVSDNNTITITGYSGPGGDVVIPAEIDGKPVTSVGHRAFMDHIQREHDRMISSIRFPEGLTSVGREAFRDNRVLTDVYIPASLTSITRPAFGRCRSIMNFHIHEDNPEFRSIDGVWYTKDMTELRHFPQGRGGEYTIPDGVTRIRDEAFRFNDNITGISIPDSVTWIGKQAFRGCEKLIGIKLPESLESLVRQGRHFMDCTSLKSIVIPDGVTEIPQHTFRGCTGLEQVTLPANLTTIQQAAFQDCTSLKQITIPASLTHINGSSVFAGCENLQGILFLGDAPKVSGRDHFPSGVTIYRTPGTSGWPEPGEQWMGQKTAISKP